MIKSMTGFGRGEFTNELYKFKIEIKSVNHRYNDITVKLPRHIMYLEESIKKMVKEKINRGKVDIYINLEYINESAIDIKVDIPLAKSYELALKELSKELELKDNISLSHILDMSEIVRTERRAIDEDLLWECLHSALSEALDDIMAMRENEGKELKKDMESKLNRIEELIIKIEKRSPIVVLEYKDKLRERIENLMDQELELDEDKLNMEIVFVADKSNINEEIVRLKSHIGQFNQILNEEGNVGRKLDFLVQEMNREINTIGSKANDSEISSHVVEVKSEIEQIREQIQNVE